MKQKKNQKTCIQLAFVGRRGPVWPLLVVVGLHLLLLAFVGCGGPAFAFVGCRGPTLLPVAKSVV